MIPDDRPEADNDWHVAVLFLPAEAAAPAGEGGAVRLEERVGEAAPEAARDRPGDVPKERRRGRPEVLVAADLRALGEVAGELPLEGATDPGPVRTEGSNRSLHLLREERRRDVGGRTPDGPPEPTPEALRPPEDDEGETRGRPEGPDRVVPDPGRDVDGRPDGRLGPAEFLGEGPAGGYDFGLSGCRSRIHSIVSFVVSIVSLGQ
jgi:hypothetical protein